MKSLLPTSSSIRSSAWNFLSSDEPVYGFRTAFHNSDQTLNFPFPLSDTCCLIGFPVMPSRRGK